MTKTTQTGKLLVATPLVILVAHYLAVFPHEYAHSFTAWLLGYKENPLALTYGGTSWLNLLLLFHIDENVNYSFIYTQGNPAHMALIAFAGAGIANVLLYLFSLYLLGLAFIQKRALLYYFVFWFNFMNLANFYDYIPVRTFATHGDMAHITIGLGISPWYLYIFGGYLVAFVIWHFFTNTLICAFKQLNIKTTCGQASLLCISVIILFGYFGMAGFINYGEVSHFISTTSFIAIPGIIIACWPTRAWVRNRFLLLAAKQGN